MTMLPLWRRLRLAFTVIFTVIGVALLVLAWALIGRFPGSTVIILAMIAVILPIAIYGLMSVTGWQRSMASGVQPTGLVGWIIRRNLTPILPIMFLFFLLGLGREMDLTPLDRDARSDDALSASMTQSCVASARKAITANGGDPDSPAMQRRASTYCNCVTVGLQREYTPDEFIRLARGPAQLDKEERVRGITDSCAKASAG